MRHLIWITVLAAVATTSVAGTIGFLEDFSLAPDRAKPLADLVPGTHDYFYYHALHQLNQGDNAAVDKTLAAWRKSHPHSRPARYTEILNRQMLLNYDDDAKKTLGYITNHLRIYFNHQPERAVNKAHLPTTLDPKLIAWDTLYRRALANSSHSTSGFTPFAYYTLTGKGLSGYRLRDLLGKLSLPDAPNLVQLIAADLQWKNHPRTFGSLAIERALTRAQLDALVKRMPTLLNQQNFVQIYLTKLAPAPDTDLRFDRKAKRAYLNGLWEFAQRLDPVHNSLKACILHQLLLLDEVEGLFDEKRFQTYIALPRVMVYYNSVYLRQLEKEDRRARTGFVDFRKNYSPYAQLPPIQNDTTLVGRCLAKVFADKNTWDLKPYTAYLSDHWLRRVFAETHLLNGTGDAKAMYAILGPSAVQRLKDRIEINFTPTNPQLIAPDAKVSLDVDIKNVEKLLVKVYEIDEYNVYRTTGRPISTAIDLDGLVANSEVTHTYTEPPIRRVKRTLTFPQCNARGVYVIELIGNGISSRAVIQKGKLRSVVKPVAGGQVVYVFDEANQPVKTATVYLDEQTYTADKTGAIQLPFSNTVGQRTMILSDGVLSSLGKITCQQERYALHAGFYVDRESLIAGNTATLLVRPRLTVAGHPIPPSLLSKVKLIVTARNLDGVTTTSTVDDFKLLDDQPAKHSLRVPARLQSLSFTLRGEIDSVLTNKPIQLNSTGSVGLNAQDNTATTIAPYLSQTPKGYVVSIRGKNGEPKVDYPATIIMQHRDFTQSVHVSMKTDETGQIALGPLPQITTLTATLPGSQPGIQTVARTWPLVNSQASQPRTVNARLGQPVRIAYVGPEKNITPGVFSLFEMRNNQFIADRTSSLRLETGAVVIDDLPAGNYRLSINEAQPNGARWMPTPPVMVQIVPGPSQQHTVFSPARAAELSDVDPLCVAGVTRDKDGVTLKLIGLRPSTRVQVGVSRFVPAYFLFGSLYQSPRSRISWPIVPVESLYVAGRKLSDEYRYILDRQFTKPYPGNMLARPGLLLNPWAIRKAATGKLHGRGGSKYDEICATETADGAEGRFFGTGTDKGILPGQASFTLDFLASPATLLTNLTPDADGVVHIPAKLLGDHQQIHLLAMDHDRQLYKVLPIAATAIETRDLRLAKPLPLKTPFSQQRNVTTLTKGQTLTIADVRSSRINALETLADVYRTQLALNGGTPLREFGFILNWPTLTPEKQRELYSKYACHELSFFLSRKDLAFFANVIKPYLANKKDKTFLDEYLLEADLSKYTTSWRYDQLNLVERILLSGRMIDDKMAARTARSIRERWELLTPNPSHQNYLFETVLKGKSLAAGRSGIVPGSIVGGGRVSKDFGAVLAPSVAPASAPPKRSIRSENEGLYRDGKAEKDSKPLQVCEDKQISARELNLTDGLERARSSRSKGRKLAGYVPIETTQIFAENNYYKLPIAQQNGGLIGINEFWKDFAAHGDGPFLSRNLAEATRNFTEMMFVLSLIDLPFTATNDKAEVKDGALTLTAQSPMIVYHEEVQPAKEAADKRPLLVSQNFYRVGDRYRFKGNEKLDKFVTDEFLPTQPYGALLVATNPTSTRQRLSVLTQVPAGAMPLARGRYTHSRPVVIEPYSTVKLEYLFYFPTVGEFDQYPMQAAVNGDSVAAANPMRFHVVPTLTKIDKTSWQYISQHGTNEQVLEYLRKHNIYRTPVNKIAWRMRDKAMFTQTLALLQQRQRYDATLFSYGLHHGETAIAKEYLQHRPDFIRQCGLVLNSLLLTIDPIEQRTWQYLEFKPLVNARSHRFGKGRQIPNESLFAQYMTYMHVLSYEAKLTDDQELTVAYYLFLQDRIADALTWFDKVDPKKLPCPMGYDYFAVYCAVYRGEVAAAKKITARYADYPVDKWQKRFAAAAMQLAELDGAAVAVADDKNRDQQQTARAAAAPSLTFAVEDRTVTVNYRNVTDASVRYYKMDLELLFSGSPFVQSQSGNDRFSYIKPNLEQALKLPAGKTEHTFALPKELANSNVLIEIRTGAIRQTRAYYANSLDVQIAQNFGQLTVTDAKTRRPLPVSYVKVYARMANGQVKYYKDGYTDLRGRFDYTSLSTNDLPTVRRFAILVMSKTHGAVVREIAPPKR